MKDCLKCGFNIFLLTIIWGTGCIYRNESQAKKFLNFTSIDKDLIIVTKNEEWNNNPGGDGWEYVVFSFKPGDSLKIKKECIANKFKDLPIEESALPDGAIYKFIDSINRDGYYKLEIDSTDKMNYSLAVVDLDKRNIIVYRSFY